MVSEAIYLGTKLFNGREDPKARFSISYYGLVDSRDNHLVENYPAVYQELSEYNEPGKYLFDDLKIGDRVKVSFSLKQGKDAQGYEKHACKLEDVI